MEKNLDRLCSLQQLAGKPKFLADLDAFTDGSKETSTQDTGAGFVIMKGEKMLISNKRWVAHAFKLSPKNTVFQAEIFAIFKCCQLILSHTEGSEECWIKKNESLDLYCDSQSAILALNSIFVQSKLVCETVEILNKVAEKVARL